MKKKRQRSTSILPNEIIYEILSRLPVKCLMQLKIVCKSWHNLISDPGFAKHHLEQSKKNEAIRCEKLMLVDISLYSIDYEDFSSRNAVKKLDYPMKDNQSSYFISVLASCNGMLCISPLEDVYFLWNPSTRESRKIPNSPIISPSNSLTCSSIFYGLGHDSNSNDYKLVRVALFDLKKFQTEVKVYSTRTNCWRQIRDFPFDFPYGRRGVSVNDAIHWIVSIWRGPRRHFMIVALSIAKESYEILELPKCKYDDSYFDIGVLGECLSLFRTSYSTHDAAFDVWVMKKYGEMESWTKLKIVLPFITRIEAYGYLAPLCVSCKGEIVVRVGANKLVLYDPRDETLRHMVVDGMPEHFEIVTYLESLVSPNVNINAGNSFSQECIVGQMID